MKECNVEQYVPVDIEQAKHGRECFVVGGKNFRTDNRNEAPARFLGVLDGNECTARAAVFAADTVGDGVERVIVQNLVSADFGGLQVVMKKQKKEYWVNVYAVGDGVAVGAVYSTKHHAEMDGRSVLGQQYVTTVKVYEKWEE